MHKIGFLAALASVAFVTAAQATPITRTYNITAQDFSTGILNNGPAPTDPLTASITVTFDPSVDVTDQTTGIILNSINRPLESSPVSFNNIVSAHQLEFGLLDSGTAGFNSFPSFLDDFTLSISQPDGPTPQLVFGAYSSQTDNDFYLASDGKVGFTAATPVPEPSSIALLLSGLAGCILLARRRKPVA